uniref:Protein NATD1 n=1 Tax=Oncorhynchus kisutch TaxID=8019 RepID=A0A8C7H5P8_ONCKI
MALRKLIFRVYALNSTPHSVKGLNTHMSAFSVLSPNTDLRVKHDRHNLCFSINLDGEGHQDSAVLRYKFTSKKEVDLLSTYVPESFRGKGVAALLSKAAMDFLVEENLKAHISCCYIKKYVEETPLLGYKDLIIV